MQKEQIGQFALFITVVYKIFSMGKPRTEEQQSITRLELPVRRKEEQEADSESEPETEAMASMVARFRQLSSRTGKSSLGDYLSLPSDMEDVKLSCKLESGVENSQLYLNTDGDLVERNVNKSKGKKEDYSGAARADHKPHIGKRKISCHEHSWNNNDWMWLIAKLVVCYNMSKINMGN